MKRREQTTAGPVIHRCSLRKPTGQHFVFRWPRGREHEVIMVLAEYARLRRFGFDWYDAAQLSHQVGHSLVESLLGKGGE